MRQVPHRTLIGTIREHVIAWRRDTRLSREKVVQLIIEAHEQIGASTSIVFDPVTRDEDERKKVNAERVFRWLDDESKDNNLLPANFIPSILAAMPVDRRLACSSEFMVSIGLGACLPSEGEEGELTINHVFEVQLDDVDALQAVTRAIQNPTMENLTAADLKMTKAQKRREWLHKRLAGAKKAVAGTKAVFGRLVHGKVTA